MGGIVGALADVAAEMGVEEEIERGVYIDDACEILRFNGREINAWCCEYTGEGRVISVR